jgi:two-component system, chemotaxis family, protein-glutamate methylesterase/glutaminase
MFGDKEKEILLKLAEELTGGIQAGDTRRESLISNVQRRIRELNLPDLHSYLERVDEDPSELAHLVSALTIHTTSWFRENPHFVVFQEVLLEALTKNEVFTLWSSACSTGEEAYSFAIMLEEFRTVHPRFDYRVVGTDIDPVSVETARRAIYSDKQINFNLSRYSKHLMYGSGKTEGHFTLSKEIRSRCSFRVADLRDESPQPGGPFHVCVCRNVLIYFSAASTSQIVRNLLKNVRTEGYLFLGHSETIHALDFGVTQRGHSVFVKSAKTAKPIAVVEDPSTYTILVVDDSATARKQLQTQISKSGFNCLTASSAREASDLIESRKIDLITLDMQMPDMNGDSWLEHERGNGLKTPVVIISEVHAADADAVVQVLAWAAQDYIEKSLVLQNPDLLKETFLELIRGQSKPVRRGALSNNAPKKRPEVIVIGASTGGPQALAKVLCDLPSDAPPVLVTQHISAKFARPLAERVALSAGLQLAETKDGEPLRPGHVYFAFEDHHIGVQKKNGELCLLVSNAPPVNSHRPSVDFLFQSLATIDGSALAILLTGMGRDGSLGMMSLHRRGVFCVAQSEEDCVVYGMPRAAIELGAVDFTGNLDQIHSLVQNSLALKKSAA